MGRTLRASDTIYYEEWDIASLEIIGGHSVTVFGDPEVVNTELGDAIKFDGDGDRILVDFNPVMDAKEFTVELIFKPEASYPNNLEPRFLHMQDPDDPDGKRVMIELRIDANNMCYMDGFIKTDIESLALIDEKLVHPTEVWQHVAITYRDSTFTTYFNGNEELSGTLRYAEKIVNTVGKTSIGGRMNDVAFFAGLIKTLKVTHTCLEPKDFVIPELGTSSAMEASELCDGIKQEVFPNPADQGFNLMLRPGLIAEDVEISIFDLSGKLHMSKVEDLRDQVSLAFDTSDFMDGIYLLSIKSDHQSNIRKFVVLH
jgi:hypothetical protein